MAYSYYSYGSLAEYKEIEESKESNPNQYKLCVTDSVYDSGKPVLSIEKDNIYVKYNILYIFVYRSEGLTHIIVMIEFKDTEDTIPVSIIGKQKQISPDKEIDKSFNYTFYCDCSVRNMYCIPYVFQSQSDCIINVEIPFKYIHNIYYSNVYILYYIDRVLFNVYGMIIHVLKMKYIQISFLYFLLLYLFFFNFVTIESQNSNALLSTTQLALALCTDILKIESLPDDTIKETLDRISEELDKSKPLDNFEQWSVWFNQTEEFDNSNIEVNASSVNGQKGSSKNILKDDSNNWESLLKEDPSYIYIYIILYLFRWLTLTLPQPTVISSLILSFSKSASDNITPDELKIYTKNSNEGYVLRYKVKSPDSNIVKVFLNNIEITHIYIELKGYNSKTTSSHSIRYIQLFTPISTNTDITTKSSKDLLIDIFRNILMNNKNEELKMMAFNTLIVYLFIY